jgi:hypothetical protein
MNNTSEQIEKPRGTGKGYYWDVNSDGEAVYCHKSKSGGKKREIKKPVSEIVKEAEEFLQQRKESNG